MWCKLCQQDVPGIVSAGTGRYRCPRCGEDIDAAPSGNCPGPPEADCAEWPADEARSGAIRIHSQEQTSKPVRPIASSLYDGSAVEEDLRELGRILTPDDDIEDSPTVISRQRLRLDDSHAGFNQVPDAVGQSTRRAVGTTGGNPFLNHVISKAPWAVLCLGVAAFACGGVLMSWSIVAQRQELWSIGIPILLLGQIGFLVGLILQLDLLGNENRHTATKLDRLDHQLHDSTTAGRSLAERGAADKILADLRGQLDLLSEKISQENDH